MSAYPHSARIKLTDHLGMHSTEQFASEQSIFHPYRNQNKLLIHIPTLSSKNHHHYPNLFLSSTKKPSKIHKPSLEATSKTPLNVGLDNILFISTLGNYWTRTATSTFNMKRHASSSGAQNYYYHDNSINATTTARRYSHPDTNKTYKHQHYAMTEYPSITCSSSSSSSSNSKSPTSHDIRRLSFQSDAASTELIRRFSSESTTSSLSSMSSFIFESHIKLHHQQQQKQTKVPETSSDAQTNHSPAVEAENNAMNLIQTAAASSSSTTAPPKKEPLSHDPGHACETMHSPSRKMQQPYQSTRIKEEEERLPVWADPIKVKENPTRFHYTKSYLQQRDMLHDSSLPLSKPCVFYFSDSNYNNKNNNKSEQYVSAVKPVFECDTVWGFAARWRTFKEKYNKRPSQLTPKQNVFCFIQGVEPMWEDPVNENGGRLIITVYNSKLLDDLFEWILCAFIGGGLFENGVVGIAVSKRYSGDRVEIWFDQSADDATMPVFKNKLCELLASTCHSDVKASRYKKHFK